MTNASWWSIRIRKSAWPSLIFTCNRARHHGPERRCVMPFFVFCAHDKPGTGEARMRARELHRAYIRIAQEGCRCVAGGPLMDESGAQMTGTLLVFEARDRKAVETFVSNDP